MCEGQQDKKTKTKMTGISSRFILGFIKLAIELTIHSMIEYK